jgi:hypothetical protein
MFLCDGLDYCNAPQQQTVTRSQQQRSSTALVMHIYQHFDSLNHSHLCQLLFNSTTMFMHVSTVVVVCIEGTEVNPLCS